MADTDAPALLCVRDLRVHYRQRSPRAGPGRQAATVAAVDGVSLDLRMGQTLGLVGESGSGKSTLARALLNLVPAQAGSVRWLGQEMRGASMQRWQSMRRSVQMVFQDLLGSLDPRMTVGQAVAEPLLIHRPDLDAAQRQQRVCDMLLRVGLDARHMDRYPHAFSGGQCQRIAIARALVLAPRLIICDEPVSALDSSVRAQVINLLRELQQERGLALLFIAHDLAVVRHICHHILVMYRGRVVEQAPSAELFARPQHPYTQALLSAIPIPDPQRERCKTVQVYAPPHASV